MTYENSNYRTLLNDDEEEIFDFGNAEKCKRSCLNVIKYLTFFRFLKFCMKT